MRVIAEGLYNGVCIGVHDLGPEQPLDAETPPRWHYVEIRWEITAANGAPHILSKRYANTLNDKSALRRMLEVWRGARFTRVELAGFDLELLRGAHALLRIVHVHGDCSGQPGCFAGRNLFVMESLVPPVMIPEPPEPDAETIDRLFNELHDMEMADYDI